MATFRWLRGVALAATLVAATAVAQQYPTKSIRMIVPLPPGTASDLLARAMGSALSERYKQQIVIDNRPGAGPSAHLPSPCALLP